MHPKVLRDDIAEYTQAEFHGVNYSGIQPIGGKVLILTDGVSEKTVGGVTIPEELRERQAMGAITGVIVAIGEGAFLWNDDKTRPWSGYKPQVGDHVYFTRHSGVVFPGDDGKKYRIVSYECIGAVRNEPAPLEEAA